MPRAVTSLVGRSLSQAMSPSSGRDLSDLPPLLVHAELPGPIGTHENVRTIFLQRLAEQENALEQQEHDAEFCQKGDAFGFGNDDGHRSLAADPFPNVMVASLRAHALAGPNALVEVDFRAPVDHALEAVRHTREGLSMRSAAAPSFWKPSSPISRPGRLLA